MPKAEVFVVMTETYVYAADAAAAREKVKGRLERITPEPVTSKALPLSDFDPFGEQLRCDWCDWWRERDQEATDPHG